MSSKVYVWKYVIWQIWNLKIDWKLQPESGKTLNHTSGKEVNSKKSGWAKYIHKELLHTVTVILIIIKYYY